MMTMGTQTGAVSAGELSNFIRQLFQAVGMGEEDARLLSASHVDSDCHGMRTHGTARVAAYCAQLACGQVNSTPQEHVVAEKPSALLIDADRGFGAPVGIRAVERAILKARETGACLAGVTDVAHFGAAGFYTRYAAERGFLAFAMSSTFACVLPFGDRTASRCGTGRPGQLKFGRIIKRLIGTMMQMVHELLH